MLQTAAALGGAWVYDLGGEDLEAAKQLGRLWTAARGVPAEHIY